MGHIGRLKRVTMGRIEAFLASREDPEQVLPALIEEMAQAVSEAARGEAKAVSAVKADTRRLDGAAGRVSRLEKGAVLALEAGEIDTARQAVAAQLRAENELTRLREQLEISENALHTASQVRSQLQEMLKDLKQRKSQLLARVRQLKSHATPEPPGSELSPVRATAILDWVTQMDDRLEESEMQIEIQDQVTKTLGLTFQHERAKELESDEQVEQRLAELRKRIERGDEHHAVRDRSNENTEDAK